MNTGTKIRTIAFAIACVAGTNLRMLTTVQGLNVYAKVTFSK